jgi:hypothetical protein
MRTSIPPGETHRLHGSRDARRYHFVGLCRVVPDNFTRH